jgi:hypothetical protein
MYQKNNILLACFIICLFVVGIWDGKILRLINALLTTYLYESSWSWIRYIFVLFVEKIPVIAQNLSLFIFVFAQIVISVLCLKIYFSWTQKFFFQLLMGIYLGFLLFAVSLIVIATRQKQFFKVYDDFTTFFTSPFLLILLFLIFTFTNKR